MKKDFIRLGISLLILIFIFYLFQQKQLAKESITYFPIDPSVTFPKATTSLDIGKYKNDEYAVQWETSSTINKRAYLRQDMSFLFANGILIDTLGEWKQNTLGIEEKKTVVAKDARLFKAISFHFAEIHDQDNRIFSSQKLSEAFLFVIHTNYEKAPLAFITPHTNEEKDWAKRLQDEELHTIQFSLKQGIKKYGIIMENYPLKILLTDLVQYNEKPFDGFTMEQTSKIIGQLTEGLYKNYFLGIRKEDGSTIEPLGSTVPILLLSKNHLLILFTASDGEVIVLRQQISTL